MLEVAAVSTICVYWLLSVGERLYVALFIFSLSLQHFISLSLLFSLFLGSGTYKHCNESFLFSIVNASGVGPTKLKLKGSSNQSGICCNSSFGPVFGAGNDLCIYGNSNANSNSHSNLNNTYECPPNVNASTFLAGNSKFCVDELEVFVYQSTSDLP